MRKVQFLTTNKNTSGEVEIKQRTGYRYKMDGRVYFISGNTGLYEVSHGTTGLNINVFDRTIKLTIQKLEEFKNSSLYKHIDTYIYSAHSTYGVCHIV